MIQGLPDLLAYGQASAQNQAIEEESSAYGKYQQPIARIIGVNEAFSSLLSNVAMWFVLIMAIPMVTAGELLGGMLAAP